MKSNWTTTTIDDVCSLVTDGAHNSPKSVEKGYYMASVKDFTEYGFDFSSCRQISEEDYEKLRKHGCVPEKDDVLIGKDGARYFEDIIIYRQDEQPALLSSIAILRANRKKITPEFLYYTLKIPAIKKDVRDNYGSGSAIPRVVLKDFKRMPFSYPDIDEQRKITAVCSVIDAKIQVNNAINKNLEQQAKAVFKSWFEDFDSFDEPLIETPAGIYAPASLQMVQIANIPHVLETGKRPKGGAVASGVPSIGAENVKQLGVVNFSSAKFIPEEFAAKMKTGAINGYELLLYKDGGKPGTFIPHFSMFGEGFPYQKFFINEHVFKLDFGDKGFNEFAYFFMQTDYAYHWLASNGGKAAVPGINQQNVKDIWIFSPENSKVKEFGEWVQPLFTTILKNCAQNVKLAELRDTLLPKLMSGELDVSDIDL